MLCARSLTLPSSLSLSLTRTRPLPSLSHSVSSSFSPSPSSSSYRSFHTTSPSLLNDPIRMPNDGTTKRGRRLLEIAHIQQRAISAAESSLKTFIPLTSDEIKSLNETTIDKVNRVMREAHIPPQYWKQEGQQQDKDASKDASSPSSTSSSSPTSPFSLSSTSTSTSSLPSTIASLPKDPYTTTDNPEFSMDEDDDDNDIDIHDTSKDVIDDSDQKIVRVKKIDQWGRAYGSGGRKTATSRVWIKPGTGEFTVNYQPHSEYFHHARHRFAMFYPFLVTDTPGKFDVFATVKGGGLNGQAEAIRHGIARALQNYEPTFRPALKAAHLLTRDNRQVERKKPGRYKARKGYTFVKR